MNKDEIKNITLKYLKETYSNQNHLHKDTERIFENYVRCRSFRDFSRGLEMGYNLVREKMSNIRNIREKFTEIAKKHHLHHYGDLEPAIEEMIIYINELIDSQKTNNIIDKHIHEKELKLRILVTNICNKNCSFCLNDFQEKTPPMFVDLEIVKYCIEFYADTFKDKYPLQVYFSGGEPTLHNDLIDMMKFAMFAGCRVTLNTNGIFSETLEENLVKYSTEIHFGTYIKSKEHAERVKRMNGTIQCIFPFVDDSFIEFYLSYGLHVKVFQDFNDYSDKYIYFAQRLTKKFNSNLLSFRHTGIQENRGIGCNECEKKCITLKAIWLFPDGGTSPCPQLYKHKLIYPKTKKEWISYLELAEQFHKV
jgi:organic radical activating enzyme